MGKTPILNNSVSLGDTQMQRDRQGDREKEKGKDKEKRHNKPSTGNNDSIIFSMLSISIIF